MTEFNPSTSARPAPSLSGGCALGSDCERSGSGHVLSFMQRRLAAATSAKWRDAIVHDVSDGGRLRLTTISDDEEIVLWHHSAVGHLVQAGEPVAFHEIYHVLAVGSAWFNVSIEDL